mgnify:CR=1 FL=1
MEEEELRRKNDLPRNNEELTSRLNIRYTKVPTENRKDFLDSNSDKIYFIVNRQQPIDPREALPFSMDIGNYYGLNESPFIQPGRNIYKFEKNR